MRNLLFRCVLGLSGCLLLIFNPGCGAPCTLQENADGTATLTCGGKTYTVKNGKDGKDGAKGEQGTAGATGATGAAGTAGATGATGEKGEKGDPGPKGDPVKCTIEAGKIGSTAKITCGDLSWVVLKGENFEDGKLCTTAPFECGLVKVTCGTDTYTVGNNTCIQFLVEELDSSGKIVKTLKNGDAKVPGDKLDVNKNYRMTIFHKYAGAATSKIEVAALSNVGCNGVGECFGEHCATMRKDGAFDLVTSPCASDADCTAQGGSTAICKDKRCYKPHATLTCTQDDDCTAKGEAFCQASKCYTWVADETRYAECKELRDYLGPGGECVNYPWHNNTPLKPSRCTMMGLGGNFKPALLPCTADKDCADVGGTTAVCKSGSCYKPVTGSTCTANTDCTTQNKGTLCDGGICHDTVFDPHRLTRTFPLGGTCNFSKFLRSNQYASNPLLARLFWEQGFYQHTQGSDQFEFVGFVRFTDGSLQYFRYQWFTKAEINACVCPPSTKYNPGTARCE
ncbi:hypothetical protein L6R29_21960 [Myxococcota bacterium]|nr:hypothetical protein [Myxococcota bacterium]